MATQTISGLSNTAFSQDDDYLVIERGEVTYKVKASKLRKYINNIGSPSFEIPSKTGAIASDFIISDDVTFTGNTLDYQAIKTSGDGVLISINSGDFVQQALISDQDSFRVKMVTPSSSFAQKTGYVTAGDVTKSFLSTNGSERYWTPEDSIHNPFIDVYADNKELFEFGENISNNIFKINRIKSETSPIILSGDYYNGGDNSRIIMETGEDSIKTVPYFFQTPVIDMDTNYTSMGAYDNNLSGIITGLENVVNEYTMIVLFTTRGHSSVYYDMDLLSFGNSRTNFGWYNTSDHESIGVYGPDGRISDANGANSTLRGTGSKYNSPYSTLMFSSSYDGTSGHYYEQGEYQSGVARTNRCSNPRHVFLGARYDRSARNSYIYAAIGLTGHSDASEIHKWEGYLADRFNCKEVLYDSHPYKIEKPKVSI